MKNLIKTSAFLLGAVLFIGCDPEEEETPNVDLAVTDITFSITGIDHNAQDFEGTATITAVITNIGADPYVSNSNQQGVLLYEQDLGLVVGTIVVDQEFGNLGVGESITVSYSRAWNQSSPAEGEFPPNYRAVITFDPDLYIDGNSSNDDALSTNNERTESSEELNF
jgi:hypothetical protein